MTERGRVVILAGAGESTNIVYNALQRAIGVYRVIVEQGIPTNQLLRRRVEKLGVRTVIGQVLFKVMIESSLRRRARARLCEIKQELGLDGRAIPEDVVLRVASVNSPEAIAHLRNAAPAVVVVNGTRIISKKVLSTIDAPFINTHAGITPLYRGVHGGYWALANSDRAHCGVSVHLVDAGIDTGGIVAQALIAPTKNDNFVTYPLLQVGAGLPLLVDAVRGALDGTLRSQPAPRGVSRLFSHPTLGQYLAARMRNGTR